MSFKKKNIILLIMTLLFCILSWKLAFKETYNLYQNIEIIENDLKNAESAPEKILKLETELNLMNGNTIMLYSSVLEMRESLLAEISHLTSKYNVKFNSFPEYYIQEKENFELTTSPIVLQGSFRNLLLLLAEFEKNNTSGKISSTNFRIEESPRNGKRSLYLTLYIQSINVEP